MGHHNVITIVYISVDLWIFWRVFDNMATVLYGPEGRVIIYGRIVPKSNAKLLFCDMKLKYPKMALRNGTAL